MCDDVELAQDFTLQFHDNALRAHMAARKPVQLGLAACIDCDEEISPARQRLGADRCIECQSDEDLRKRNCGSRRTSGA